jgi:hypothetical protein
MMQQQNVVLGIFRYYYTLENLNILKHNCRVVDLYWYLIYKLRIQHFQKVLDPVPEVQNATFK